MNKIVTCQPQEKKNYNLFILKKTIYGTKYKQPWFCNGNLSLHMH